jgi:hypothetical protein
MTDLQGKMERYERKAAHCRALAEQTSIGPEREFFEVLATYYGRLANDFRQAIARQAEAPSEELAHPA